MNNMTNEIWKDIPGYEGVYRVSNLGRVKSLDYNHTKVSKLLKNGRDKNNYLRVVLCKNKKAKTFHIHQLVAMAFLDHKPCGYILVVDHINNIRDDNRVENLQIVTTRENVSKDQKNRSSKYIGVYIDGRAIRAAIAFDGNRIALGTFNNEIEASEYYQNALKAINEGNDIVIKVKNHSSKYNNVHFSRTRNLWVANKTINSKTKYIGSFNTELEAHSAVVNYV